MHMSPAREQGLCAFLLPEANLYLFLRLGNMVAHFSSKSNDLFVLAVSLRNMFMSFLQLKKTCLFYFLWEQKSVVQCIQLETH